MNKRHYEHTLPNIRGSLSNTYDIVKPLKQILKEQEIKDKEKKKEKEKRRKEHEQEQMNNGTDEVLPF